MVRIKGFRKCFLGWEAIQLYDRFKLTVVVVNEAQNTKNSTLVAVQWDPLSRWPSVRCNALHLEGHVDLPKY